MKICSLCKLEKSKSDFPMQNKKIMKVMSACKECSNKRQREKRLKNPEEVRKKDKKSYLKNREKRIAAAREYRKKYPDRTRNTNLKVNYGITQKDYEQIKNKQMSRCAICKTHELDLKRILCVDHDHSNGKVRGLLCDTCNKFLGFYEVLHEKCRDYLSKH
jgi:hypothetical protein